MKIEQIIIGFVIAAVLVLALMSFGVLKLGNSSPDTGNSANMPEKCKLPAGQDIQAWKEHLGHHAETQECLRYYK